jgi:chromosome segregation protein
MLEEAAGIAGLHVRRRDAEQKLRATEANLSRLEDLMAGLETRILSLRRQARAAERYRHLSEQIRVAEARVLFARWREAAQAADRAKAEARQAQERVSVAQTRADAAQAAQAKAAQDLISTRDGVGTAREAASAIGHRLSTLTSQLEAARAKLNDLDRQQARLESDRAEADQLTRDAAAALQNLQGELEDARRRLNEAEAQRPAMVQALQEADSNARAAEIAYAQANAQQASVEAEWRVAEAEIAQAQNRVQRCQADLARNAEALAALDRAGDPIADLANATLRRDEASAKLAQAREQLATSQQRRAELLAQRDAAASALSQARADLAVLSVSFTPCNATAKHGPRRKRMPPDAALPLTIYAPLQAMNALWPQSLVAMPRRRWARQAAKAGSGPGQHHHRRLRKVWLNSCPIARPNWRRVWRWFGWMKLTMGAPFPRRMAGDAGGPCPALGRLCCARRRRGRGGKDGGG